MSKVESSGLKDAVSGDKESVSTNALPKEVDIKNMSQQELLAMSKQITEQFEQPPTKFELMFGGFSYLVIYGGGIAFGLYMIFWAYK